MCFIRLDARFDTKICSMDTPKPRHQPTTFNDVLLNRTLNQGNKYNIRFPRGLHKWIRWSKELSLVGIALKI